MNIEMLIDFLFWCLMINLGLYVFWVMIFWCAHDWVYRFHSKMFKLSVETFDAVIYGFLGAYKIMMIMFVIVPYVALNLMG